MPADKTVIMLVNLGTPDAPEADAIRVYLKQFLSDPRVVDYPRWFWLPILNGIILRTRPPKLVEKYEMVWGTRAGPIKSITEALALRMQKHLPACQVVSAMTYGNPSMPDVLNRVKDAERILVLPLFPQYAGATTGAVADAWDHALAEIGIEPDWELIEEYHTDNGYIDALASSIAAAKAFRDSEPHLVFSFHGIPQSQSDRGDPYARQCQTTARLVAAKLNLPENRFRITFQSRFGPLPWLQPYTDKTMEALPGEGIDNVLVVCPGFSVDCLETIEEIKLQNKDIFMAAGGKHFNYVKALNATEAHAALLANLVKGRLNA